MKITTQHKLTVKPSSIHGHGVFANINFAAGEVIERCYIILTLGKDEELRNYYFKAEEKSAVPTGFGFIYNHANEPNASYDFEKEHHFMVFTALRPIKKGEEILISYGESWFSDRNVPVKKISHFRCLFRFLSRAPLRTGIVISALLLFSQWLQILAAR
jgi:hypothetical protein